MEFHAKDFCSLFVSLTMVNLLDIAINTVVRYYHLENLYYSLLCMSAGFYAIGFYSAHSTAKVKFVKIAAFLPHLFVAEMES